MGFLSGRHLKSNFLAIIIHLHVLLAMKVTLLPALISVLPLVTFLAHAAIDSGGGKSSGGGFYNHAFLGEPFATIVTQVGTATNHQGLIQVLYPITPSSITDINSNGLPDGWEVGNFGSLGVDPSADADNDGTSNRMEYLAGTDPNSNTSLFRPSGSYNNGIFQMPMQTVVGRNYKVSATRDLTNWTLLSTITGDGTQKAFEFDQTTITSGPLFSATLPSSYFFRVEIVIP